jgi:hypothetical protein
VGIDDREFTCYKPPPVQLSLLSVVGIGALAGACQNGATNRADPGAADVAKTIAITDPSRATVASITLIEPCRAKIDGVDLIVGVAPLVAQLGITNWTGDTSTNGTTIRREGTPVARVFAANDNELALFDAEGTVLVHATRDPATGAVAVRDKQDTIVRVVTVAGPDHLVIAGAHTPTLDVRGTDDGLLAAIVAAPEAIPEVRALAACNRLFPKIEDLGR